jgi:hypothetical protein
MNPNLILFHLEINFFLFKSKYLNTTDTDFIAINSNEIDLEYQL